MADRNLATTDGYFVDGLGVRRVIIAGDPIPDGAEFTTDADTSARATTNAESDVTTDAAPRGGSRRRT